MGADVIVATGENEPARVVSALDQLGELEIPVTALLLEGGPHLAGAFLDAGEIDEARLFVAPMLLGGGGMDPAIGEGVARIADALRAIDLDCSTERRRRPADRAAAGVVSVFTGLVQDLGSVAAIEATARRRAARAAHGARRARSPRATRSPSTASA